MAGRKKSGGLYNECGIQTVPGLQNLLYSNFRYLPCGGLYFLAIWGSMLLAYRRNQALDDDDEDKREYHPLGILIAPFSLPFVLVIGSVLWALYWATMGILFGGFLLLFPIVLLVFRKVMILAWLLDKFEELGRLLLRVNSFLLRLAGVPLPRAV